jgi:hypothetical protein
MKDNKLAVRTTLINHAPLTAIVPVARIFQGWPASFNALPSIAFREVNNYLEDQDFNDDSPVSELSEMQFDIFSMPQSSPTAIAQALDDALITDLWTRDFSEDIVEDDSGIIHRVVRYSKRIRY